MNVHQGDFLYSFHFTSKGDSKIDRNWSRQEFPMFDGTNLEESISRCIYYFDMCETPDDQKTLQAVANFKGLANERYYKHDHPYWYSLMDLAKRRFQDFSGLYAHEELKHLYQSSIVKEYMQWFERVKSPVELEFLKAFISRLTEDIKPMVHVLKPKDYLEAFEFAKYIKMSLDGQLKRQKALIKTVSP
jgi:hypothetical protein